VSIFGSKKKVFVGSVVYNLAGPESGRPDYLKTTVIGGVITGSESLGNTITDSYIQGPGIKLRNFARWARTSGYSNAVGIRSGSIRVGDSIDTTVLKEEIPHNSGSSVVVQSAYTGSADFGMWADQYIAENYPLLRSTPYTSDINGDTNTITITWDDESHTPISFSPVGFDPYNQYLYSTYYVTEENIVGPLVPGDTVDLNPSDPFPDTTDWTFDSDTNSTESVDLDTVVTTEVTYSDGSPGTTDEQTTTDNQTYDIIHEIWLKSTPVDNDGLTDTIETKNETMYLDQTGSITQETTVTTEEEDVGGGVTKTTTTTTVTDTLVLDKSYRIDSQTTTYYSAGPTQVFIYGKDSSNAELDALFDIPTEHSGSFLPFIPMRVDNQFVSRRWPNSIYPRAKRALQKATGADYSDLQSIIADNDSLEDIDYAFAVFGVSLNVEEQACRKYIYRFFESIMNDPRLTNKADHLSWVDRWEAADQSWEEWLTWRGNQKSRGRFSSVEPEPERLPYPEMPNNRLSIAADNLPILRYDMDIRWNFITEEFGTGLLKPDAEEDEFWFEIGPTRDFTQRTLELNTSGIPNYGIEVYDSVTAIYLNHQVTENTWRRLEINGLVHYNRVYGRKYVTTYAEDALRDNDESGFIIPIHEGIYKEMSLKDATQMSTACCFMVFNSYEIVKQRWYERGIFKVVLIVVAVVVAVYTGGLGAGLLGTAAGVGASLGFTGMAAIVVGAVANAIAAMVLMRIIQAGAVALFGEKIGAIVAAVASVIAMRVGTSLANGGNLATSYANMMRADSIMSIMSSVGNGYADYMSAEASETLQESQEIQYEYERQSKQLEELYAKNIGYGPGIFDPTILTDIRGSFNEPAASFLERTMMVGSDVADMSISLLTNFTDITINSELPTI
jgi:hypothetical protein